jgi:predicted ATP-binding protein involved in virulence
MKITKVTLQNFRGISSLELEFPIDQNIIALVGVNGVGKSSILDAVTMMLLASSTLSNGDDIKLSDGSLDPDPIRHSSSVYLFKDSDIKISQGRMSCGICLSGSDKNCLVIIEKHLGRPGNMTSRTFSHSRLVDFVAYYPSNRQAKVVSSPLFSEEPEELNIFSKDETSDYDIFFSWFKEIEDIENEERLERNPKHRVVSLEAVRQAIYSILGDDFNKLRVKRATNDLIISKNGTDTPVNWLSDGEKNLIFLASDLAKKLAINYPCVDNPLESEGIVLIDEIELHMHPTWQRMIIPRLTKTFPNCQFIVTTHSPQVLSHVQPESIYLLKKVGEDIVVTKPQYSYGRDSNRILEDLMDETERPAEIQDQLAELFSLIHQGQLREAQQLVNQLAATIRAGEPELSKAEVMIKRREIIGR